MKIPCLSSSLHKACYNETTKHIKRLVSLPASPALQSISQVYEQGRGKGTMTAEEKRGVKQEMAEEMEQLDRFPHGILGPEHFLPSTGGEGLLSLKRSQHFAFPPKSLDGWNTRLLDPLGPGQPTCRGELLC